MLRVRAALAALLPALVFLSLSAQANPPEYKLGDVAEADVVTPVALTVLNPEATDALKRKVSEEIRFVVRHAPETVTAAELELRDAIATARRNFMLNLQQSDFATGFARVIAEVARSAPKDLPFEKLAPLWTRGQSDDPVIESLLQPIREVMGQPIVNNKTDTAMPTNQPVRLVTVKTIETSLAPTELETAGQVVPASRVLSLWRAKRLVETYFPAGQEGMGRFAAGFVRINAVPDQAATELLRMKRTDGVAVNDAYDAGQVVVRKGQTVDRKALLALAALREKHMIGTLQSQLAQEQTKLEKEQAVAVQIKTQTKWIVASLGFVCLALVVILWAIRNRPSTALVLAPGADPVISGANGQAFGPGEGDDSWRNRAILAEGKAERAHQAIRSGVMGWMKDKFIRTLFRQRIQLLEAQKKAEAEMRELEQRLEQLHAPLQERIVAYEQRIAELEKELAAKGEENRELIGARINVARQHLTMERERFGIN
jgi:hypothetical protein